MTDRIRIDLEDLQEIMDDLPDGPNALTKGDILVIAKIVAAISHKNCAVGLTPDEVNRINRFFGNVNKGILVVVYAVLGALGTGIAAFVFWAVKQAIQAAAMMKGAK